MSVISPPLSAPTSNDTARSAYGRIRDTISATIQYSARTVEEIIKPSIKTFLGICDTNPQVAAIVATPALLAILLTLAFIVISTLILVIWTVITVSFGIAFVIVGGLVSLLLKLIVVVIATLPLAGIATGLLIGGNYAAQLIIKNLPLAAEDFTIDEAGWQKFAERTFKQGVHLVGWASNALSTVGLTSYSAFRTAVVVLHNSAEGDASAFIQPPASHLTGQSGLSNTNNQDSLHITVPSQPRDDSEVVVVEPVDIPEAEASTPNIKKRTPFKTPEDEAEI